MPDYLNIDEFLLKSDSGFLLLDARSEKEFEQGHIPSAVNLPILNNDHRHMVGTTYVRQGKNDAVWLGFQLAGPFFGSFIQTVNNLTKEKTILVYCWRGGMRSAILSWVLSTAGYSVVTLKGGYKTYRNFVLQKIEEKLSLVVVSGKTGSGKTALLHELRELNENVLDLEKLANHRGSAFGQLGLPPQPSNEQFENLIVESIRHFNVSQSVWVEAESRSIGRVKVPDCIFNEMMVADVVEINCTTELRIKRILDEYGYFPVSALAECTKKLQKRLGDLRMREAVAELENENREAWLAILLDYYDRTYAHSTGERKPEKKLSFSLNHCDEMQQLAMKIKKAVYSLKT